MNNKDYLLVGTKLKSGIREYEILSVLGQGGFGITYLAKANLLVDNIPIEALFAIKEHYISKMNERQGMSVVISNDNNRQEIKESIESFITEAKRLNKLSLHHPGIVRVNENFKANDTAYYVMEYIKGYSVRKYVRQSKTGRLTEDEALHLFHPIAETVGYLHKNKVTHLDIKPDNILIRENGQPVIIDFGLSKHYNSKGTPTSTTKAFGCSDGYSPMEQYAGITTFTPEADIYALAATLLYMLTGKDPQKSTDITPGIIRNSLPSNISEVTTLGILKAMEKLKENRTSNVDELLSLLPHSDHSKKAGTNRNTSQQERTVSNGTKIKTRKFGERKRSSMADWLFGFFKQGREKNGNKANINEFQETKEKQPTRPIDVSRPSPTLVTFINEKSLLIYFRSNTYIYGGPASFEADNLLDMPLNMYPQEKDIYEKNNSKLQRLSKTPITLLQHFHRYDGIIKRSKNFALYSQLDQYVQLCELCMSYDSLIKAERFIHENQIAAFSYIREEFDGTIRLNIEDGYISVDYQAGIFEIADVGYKGKSCQNIRATKEASLDNNSILNFIIDGLSEYSKNLYVQGTVTMLQAFPYAVGWAKAETIGHYHREEDIDIVPQCTIIPLKKSMEIDGKFFDDCDVLSVYLVDSLMDSRQWLNINLKELFGYIPNSIELTIEIDYRHYLCMEIKDKNKNDGETVKLTLVEILKEMESPSSVETSPITK